MLFAALIASQTLVPVHQIIVKPKDGGYVAEAGTFEIDQSNSVQEEIARKAAELCKDKEIEWGEYSSLTEIGKQPGVTPPKISGYYHQFRCIVPDQRVYVSAPADWEATAADEADVRRFFETYYSTRDAGDFKAAALMFQPGVPNGLSSIEERRNINKELGPGKRRITGVTWYVNPQSAKHPGAYAAIDFVGDYPAVHFYCGYLGLYRRAAGEYEIVHDEGTQFAKGDGTADLAMVAQMRAAACRGN